ncbi:monovalent cation/H(+) antiporter subunit G [Aciduricibacillus chroicocephali]|uniref:Monovalent cation/H(+) antiporter subunit G n=1 Tax=Aciduricibacillus chroicocephali TaxID=3054939 RepID=A0ABY9KVH4_9BACI|nr:monovalent cation/H(+) antiporter subunit G [Bacillaceae bacterium 44XB]
MSISVISEYIGALLILFASIISVISAIGVLRFPDVYTRAHAATKSTTLAVLSALLGALICIWATEAYISIRLLLGIVFVFITAPVAGHLIIRAAYRSGVELDESTVTDELKDVLREKRSE